MDTKKSYRHVCKKVKYGGTLTAETLRDFVWKHFLRLEMFWINNETVIVFWTAAVLARSVERLNAVQKVAGLNPRAASIFGLLK